MRILRNHLIKEFSGPFFSSLLILLFAFLLSRGFMSIADLVFNKDVDLILVLKLLFVSLPFMLTFIIPMSILVSCLITFGRLSSDNEITVAKVSGVSLMKLVWPLLILVMIISLFNFILSNQVAARSHYSYRQLLTQISVENPGAVLEEGTFIKKFKNFIIFIYEINGDKLKGVRIYQPQEGRPVRTIIAQKGEIISIPEENKIQLRLIHGTSDEPDPKDPYKLYKLNFKTYDLPLNMGQVQSSKDLSKKPKDMSIKELRTEIAKLKKEGVQDLQALVVEIYNKIAFSLSSIAFILIGIPLGITTKRSDKSINFGIALALMSLYWVLLIAGKAIAQKGLFNPFWSLQIANIVIGGVGLFLFVRLAKN